MAIKNILKKMFSESRDNFDDFGQPIQEKTIDDKLLERHLEKERRKKVREMLRYYERKRFREVSSTRMPYHDRFAKLNRVKKKRRY